MTDTRRPAIIVGVVTMILAAAVWGTGAQEVPRGRAWVASWAASQHGPYPSGNPSAQPVLDAAFESPARGAVDQTFRLIVTPDLWGSRMRFRFANTFGTQPVTFDDLHVGLQQSGGALVTGTNRRITFDHGAQRVTIPAGRSVFSDPVTLPFAAGAAAYRLLAGRRVAVSFHVVGSTGPMTWHAKALTTSYLSRPGAGSHGADEDDGAFPFTTTSWYFLDAVDVEAPSGTTVIACFGDSITDGTASTLNGDDRWPDVLSRRLHALRGAAVSVVNAGIGGNRIVGPPAYSAAAPFAGGSSALERLDRDVLGLSGLSTVIWLEGINDLSAGESVDGIIAGLRDGVGRLKAHGIRVLGATITSGLGYSGASGTPEADLKRQAVNAFIRTGGLFDGTADFDAATIDPQTGALRAEFQPNSTIGGAGDRLHPNRAGYQAMGHAIDLSGLSSNARTPAASSKQDRRAP